MSSKLQPWKATWPPANNNQATTSAACADGADSTIEYGVAKGDVVVVDGTAANVRPALRVQQHQQDTQQTDEKCQPWKASWLAGAAAASPAAAAGEIEYGVTKGATVVVDGTAANVKPAGKRVVRAVQV